MTAGLLTSRGTLKGLHKDAILDPTVANILRYKTYKTLYFRTLCRAKKLYFEHKLTQNAAVSKKTWETINEILGKAKKSESVGQININGLNEIDPLKIANHFNEFFTGVGKSISDSVPPVRKQPEDFINYDHMVPDFGLGNTTIEHIQKIIKNFKPKNSCDLQGISTKMVKLIGIEISLPLAHIFNLSLTSGIFPSKLKECRVIPIFKAGDIRECDNYRPIT